MCLSCPMRQELHPLSLPSSVSTFTSCLMGPRSKVTNLCALVICYVRKMGPDLENKRHSSLRILFTSVLDKRVNWSVQPLALKDGEGAS